MVLKTFFLNNAELTFSMPSSKSSSLHLHTILKIICNTDDVNYVTHVPVKLCLKYTFSQEDTHVLENYDFREAI